MITISWNPGITRATGDIVSAADWNNYLGASGSIDETAPAKVTTAGDLVYGTGANAIARLAGAAGFLKSTGAVAPAWADVGAEDLAITGNFDVTGITGRVKVQTGAGAPSHSAAEGTLYWDTTNDALYANNDGATAWTEVGAAAGPTIVHKTADETVNNSTTFQDDDELILPVLANEVWEFTLHLLYDSSAVADIKVGWTVPTGTTMYYSAIYLDTALAEATSAHLREGNALTIGGAGAFRHAVLSGIILTAATAGDVKLRWAQNSAEVSDTKVLKDSCIVAHKIA